MSINGNNKFIENIKQRFKRMTSWNKYRSEITAEPKSNNLDYMIDPIFRNINVFFSIKKSDNNPGRDSCDMNYMPLVEINDFKALIDNKPNLDQPTKNKQEANEKLSRHDDDKRKFIRFFISPKLLSPQWY